MEWEDLYLDTQNEWITKAEYLIKRGYLMGVPVTMPNAVAIAQKMYLKRINSSRESASTLSPPKQ